MEFMKIHRIHIDLEYIDFIFFLNIVLAYLFSTIFILNIYLYSRDTFNHVSFLKLYI